MRISTSQLHSTSLSSLLNQQARVSKTQLQISSGNKILSPADDPIGSTKILDLNQTLSMTDQYQKNIAYAKSRLGLEENVLGSVSTVLDRIRELALQGNNSTLSNQDRSAMAIEVGQRLDELLSLANTQDSNGEFIFSGHQGLIRPVSESPTGNSYIYNGDDGTRNLQISNTRSISIGHPASDVFFTMRNGNGVFTTQDAVANLGSGVIDTGTTTNVNQYDGGTYTISFPFDTTATGNLTFNDFIGTNDTLGYDLRINGISVYSVTEAGAPISSLPALETQINLSTSTTGVIARVGQDGALHLYNSNFSAAAIQVQETLSGATDGDQDTIKGYFGSQLTGTTAPSMTTTLSPAAASYYLVTDRYGNVVTEGSYQENSNIQFMGLQTSIRGQPYNSDKFTISPSINQDLFSTIKALETTLKVGYTGANGSARLNNAVNRFLVDVSQAADKLLQIRADAGIRLNVLDTQESMNEDFKLLVNSNLSSVKDLDYADAITRLNQGTTALEAAQRSYIMIKDLSLFNYLR